MAGAELSSKKRNRSSPCSSNTFVGALTRNKSQIYLQRSRSGGSRADSIRGANHREVSIHDVQHTEKKPKRAESAPGSSVVNDLSSGSIIKDLRTRRVFSPPSIDIQDQNVNGFSCKEKKSESTNLVLGRDGITSDFRDDGEKLDAGSSCEEQNLKRVHDNHRSCSDKDEHDGGCLVGGACEVEDFGKVNLGFSVKERSSSAEARVSKDTCQLTEDYVQSTPPDADTFGGQRESEMDFLNQVLKKQSDENVQKNVGGIRKDNCTTKSVLNPLARAKLFKTPGSFSYRRLLPYLTDITKDFPDAPKAGKSLNIQKHLQNKTLFNSSCQERLIDISKTKTVFCPPEGQNGNSLHQLDSKSIDCVRKSSQPFHSQEDPFVRINSLTSVAEKHYSKPLVNREIPKSESAPSHEDHNLSKLLSTIEDSDVTKDHSTCVDFGHVMLMNDGKARKADAIPSLDTPRNGLDQDLSGITDKCHSSKYDEVGQCPDRIKLRVSEGVKKLNVRHSFEVQNVNNANTVEQCSEETKSTETEGVKKSAVRDSSKIHHLNNVKLALPDVKGNIKDSVEQRSDNDGKVHIEDPNVENTQKVASNADIFSKPEVDQRKGNRLDDIFQGVNHHFGRSADGYLCKTNGYLSEKALETRPMSKSIADPLLSLKLSKIPSSLNYRRLLPYLIDVAKDKCRASESGHLLEVKKDTKDKPLSPLLTSYCNQTSAENSTDRSSRAHLSGDNRPVMITTAISGSSSDDKPRLSSPKHLVDSPVILDLPQEQESLTEHGTTSDTDQRSEISPNIVKPTDGVTLATMPFCSPFCSGSISREDAKLPTQQLHVNTEIGCMKSMLKCTNDASPTEMDSFLGASIPPGIPAAGLMEGILKRNSHGCRGICTCLNCSSFRLHAERAFEFSRNQMQNAEEVALDLMKELSQLRNMLDNSTMGADNHAVICINQVKEACRKASEAEKLAKQRLGEMNDDLNIHCRITCGKRPRVKFANYVEEQAISTTDSPDQ
ncbi:hypothetical protein SLE2022_152580 [Rubroshorea leprosula]